ncbi:MAG: mechanosensitive ion channel protein MscS [Pirellulaceae bacterium]|nr:MAG: mechanosensitive ion channel protein MscS [Pirellulaceae bacterium]
MARYCPDNRRSLRPWCQAVRYIRMSCCCLAVGALLLSSPEALAQAAPQLTAQGTSSATTDSQSVENGPPTVVATPNITATPPQDSPPSDSEISAAVEKILGKTEWFDEVEVEVHNGVVFLRGRAEDETSTESAAELAASAAGVRAVVNRMAVVRKIDWSRTLPIIMSSVTSLWRDFLAHSPLLIAGTVVLLLTALVARIAEAIFNRIAQRSRVRASLQDLVRQLMSVGIWIVGLLVAAIIIFPGLTPAKALTVLGLGSVAIGFAFKDIFENFFAGILILWKYPFDKGDFIECEGLLGKIEGIAIRTTMIRQVDGQLAVVPNAFLFKNPVDVLTNRPTRRTTILCGVAYDTDLSNARRVIEQAVEQCTTVDRHQPIEIFAQQFADSSINFEITWWTRPTPREIRQSRDEVVRAVKRALDEADIEIPFPQRTLRFPEALSVLASRPADRATSSE